MWYRNAYRVVQTPERVWHQSTAEDPFEYPLINIDPKSEINKIGLGGDAVGKGHYTSANPYVIFGKKKDGPGELKGHGYVKNTSGHLRRYKIPKGARVLDYDAVPGDHAQRIHNYSAKLAKVNPNKTFDPQKTYDLMQCFVGDIQNVSKILMDLGYDALEYTPFTRYDNPEVERQTVTRMQDGVEIVEPESDEEHKKRKQRVYEDIQKSGKNVLVFNEQMMRNPRFFTKLRTAPETLTEQDIEKEAESARKHRDTYLRLWKQGTISLESIPERIKPSREEILQMYEAREIPFVNLPLDLQAQEAVVLKAIREGRNITAQEISQANSISAGNPNNLHETLLDNAEIAAYFRIKGGSWREIPETLKQNPSFQAHLIQNNRLSFHDLNQTTTEEAANVHPEVDRAIRQNPFKFYWSSLNIQKLRPDLLHDPEVAMQIIENNPEDFKKLPIELTGNKDFLMAAMRAAKNKDFIKIWIPSISKSLQNDPEVQAILVATGGMPASLDPEKYNSFPFWKDMALNFNPNIEVPYNLRALMAMDIDIQRKYLPYWLNRIQSLADKEAGNIENYWWVGLPGYARMIPQIQMAFQKIASEKVKDLNFQMHQTSPENRSKIQQTTDALNAELQEKQAAQDQDTQEQDTQKTATVLLDLIRIASQLDEDGSAQEAQHLDDILEDLIR